MKKSLILVLTLLMVLVSVPPSLAAGGPPSGPGTNEGFSLAGAITAIGDGTITVRIVGGSPSVKPYAGKDVLLQTTESTRFLLKTSAVAVPITLADLQIGQSVSASGTIANDVWTASRITVGAELIHLQ